MIRTWPLTRLAAEVITVPVLDFNISAVSPEIHDGAGGILLLGNAPAPASLPDRLQQTLRGAPTQTRPLVMADEEGGGVQRLSPLVSPIPWPRDLAHTMTPTAVRGLAARAARQMRAVGVTVDLAPVADVDDRPGPSSSNPDGARSFSGDPALAASYTVAFMTGLIDGGVLPVVKHFPGLGGTSGNTDEGPATTEPFQQLTTTGLVPFRAAIRARAPAIMVANASVPGLTALPASLSHAVITGLLRQQLDFHGLVITDSLSAGAILDSRRLPDAVVSAVAAGADLILFGSTLTSQQTSRLSAANVRQDYTDIVNAIVTAVRAGTIALSRLTDAATAVALAAHDHLCP